MDDHKIKILICGDSYMAFNVNSRAGKYNSMHWARHLGPEFEVVNRAFPGATNLHICRQLATALTEFTPDCILLGFTSYFRLEVGESLSNCHPQANTSDYSKFYHQYIKYMPEWAEKNRNLIIAEYAVMLAKSRAPTAWVFNSRQQLEQKNTWPKPWPRLINLLEEQLTMNLIGHSEWLPNDQNGATFHVNDPDVHLQFANTVRNHFVDSVTKNKL